MNNEPTGNCPLNCTRMARPVRLYSVFLAFRHLFVSLFGNYGVRCR